MSFECRRVFLGALEAALQLTGLARAHQGRGDAVLQVVLVGPRRMADLNRAFLAHEGPTDVLAFDLENHDGHGEDEGDGVVAEIYICLDVAIRAAAEYGTTVGDECVLYAVHGMLHLTGMDDHGPEARAEMKAAEARVMRRLRDKLPLGAIFAS